MRRVHRKLIGTLLVTVFLLGGGLPVAEGNGQPLAMTNLRVAGDEGAWYANRIFWLDWDQVPGPPTLPSAVVYRLYDPGGEPLGPPVTVTRNVRSLDRVEVPGTPGIYTIEAWLLDGDGQAGPASTATLRFDNASPSPPSPEAPSRWLLGTEQAVLKISAPSLPHPISGIRGYAVSVEREADRHPCKSLARCTDEELDLVGSARDSVSLGTLPEGTNVARVVAVSGAGIPSEVATATFEVDATRPELSLQGVPTGWSSKPVQVTAQARDALSGMAPAGPDGPFTAIAVDGGAPTLARGDRVSAWVTGNGVHELDPFARDVAGNLAGKGSQVPSPAPAIVRIDEDPPRVAFAPAQDPGEPERLEATVTDALSGPSPSRGSIALRPAGTHARYRELPTEVVGNRLIARWDSDSFPDGKYEFLASGFDVAGNLGTGTARDRGAKMVLVNPVKAQASLESGFADKQLGWQLAKRVRAGRAIRFGGRLRRLGGAPIAGQEIAVTEILGTGAEAQRRTATARTGPDGTFSLRLAPGPSREVVAAYAGNRVFTRAAGAAARLTTLASVRLRASAVTAGVGRRPIVFSGKVGAVGAKRAVRGLPVELQFRYPGAEWSEFRTVETDNRGRFRYAYRFSDEDSRGVRFQFRAYVKGREGWPYEPAASRPVTVMGR